jgi:hypothetical protein
MQLGIVLLSLPQMLFHLTVWPADDTYRGGTVRGKYPHETVYQTFAAHLHQRFGGGNAFL